ncbi:transglutaminase family protein [Stakelama sp. CBK3Z-3]|uniref:Transglutaminase family protein n=1 Tax=Stakelama flava TaxID=2860338 RepID=A0ABS6XHT7_9SPHN|nr:transglutaminase family protein [Stakelama flava]MBW4329768.1 transglutaminase family protein [Stakelama flava]
MRVAVNHVTRYRFDEAQDRIIQAVRMRPCETDHQTVVAWRFDVDCDARLKKHEDGFGNEVTMIYVPGPVKAVDLVVTGEVLTDGAANGIVQGAAEPLPPELFLRSSPRTAPAKAIGKFAHDIMSGEPTIELLHKLNIAVGERLTEKPGKPEDSRVASDVFEAGEATVREMANVLVTAARAANLPARFVSGYRASKSDEPAESLHAWAEIYLSDLGWVGFDPAAGISPDQCYVRVAVGLDDADTAPFSGSRAGPGEETLDVEVQVGAAQN